MRSTEATSSPSFNPASPPDDDEDWIPAAFPDNPGDVLAEGPIANVNILNDVDERVWLSCIRLNRTPTERDIQRRIDQGDHLATFTLDAVGPIHVLGDDLEDQVTLAPWLTKPIRLDCAIFTRSKSPTSSNPANLRSSTTCACGPLMAYSV